MANIFFTIIVYVDNDEKLEESLYSIANAPGGIKERIKLVVVDPICSDVSKAVCKTYTDKYDSENFEYIETEAMDIGEAYNMAIPKIRGKYVNFSMSSMLMQNGTIETIYEYVMNIEMPKLISIAPFTTNEKGEYVPYQISPVSSAKGFEKINLQDTPACLQLLLQGYFIRTYIVKDKDKVRYFKTGIAHESSVEFLLRLLAEYQFYTYFPKLELNYSVQLEDNTSAFTGQYNKDWYTDAFKNWILPFAEEVCAKSWPMNKALQKALFYLVAIRYQCNYNDRNKRILSKDEYWEFEELTGKILNYIDNNVIYQKNLRQTFVVPRTLRVHFLNIKAKYTKSINEVVHYKEQFNMWTHEKGTQTMSIGGKKNCTHEIGYAKNMFSVKRNDGECPYIGAVHDNVNFVKIGNIDKEHVILKAVNFINGQLQIDGTLSMGDFYEKDKVALYLNINGEFHKVEYSEIYGLNKVFGVIYNRMYQFKISIPEETFATKAVMKFVIITNGEEYEIEIRTPKVHAHMRAGLMNQYWCFGDRWCAVIQEKKEIVITEIDESKRKKKEVEYRKELTELVKKGNVAAAKALEIRRRYFEHKQSNPTSRIWITHDKLYKAGDNGEYMYNYIMSQKDDVDIYYIIKEDSLDYDRMNVPGANLLIWGETETLVKVLLSEVVLATHTDVLSYAGFDPDVVPYICDLYNPLTVCIQHGLTTQDIAQYQNRVFDNLHLYTLASPNEYANLSRPIYGFDDKSVLKLTGLARYDGLKNNDKKQILITPTWRRDIANASVAHIKKGHNEFFKSSKYYEIYNKLINDKKMIESAKKNGYRIIYLLHPAASSQAEDFEKNDYVEILQATSDMNYEKILTESSLMITDYSGVQFDFAYQRKPILYYHPAALPPHYDESEAYVYERDAFGPIIDNHDALIKELCNYMDRECQAKPEYIARADKFFAYSDFDNCKRIYEMIKSYLG